jgi:hypothetical protein
MNVADLVKVVVTGGAVLVLVMLCVPLIVRALRESRCEHTWESLGDTHTYEFNSSSRPFEIRTTYRCTRCGARRRYTR